MLANWEKVKCMYTDADSFDEYDEKKEEIWPIPMTKAPTPTEKSKRQRDNTKTSIT